MLITESYSDIQTSNGPMRIFLFTPKVPHYPHAKFPGVMVFSEIYQVTGPVARFAKDIAGRGYIVAAPSSYHDFTGPEALDYGTEGTDTGNKWKVEKVCPSLSFSFQHRKSCANLARSISFFDVFSVFPLLSRVSCIANPLFVSSWARTSTSP